jgi:glucokinase
MLLAGDVGGTNMRLALFEEEGGRLVEKRRARFATRDFPTLHDALDGFLAGERRLEAAAFGVAGPVRHGRAEGTNVAFSIDAEEIRADLGAPAVVLNDLEANAWGLAELGPSDFEVLNRGEDDPAGNGALISAGTGLGEAILFRSGAGFVPMPSEGGHSSFAPRNDEEIELLKTLRLRHGHVSWERVVSGPGLATLYRFERVLSGLAEPEWLTRAIAASGDAAPVVSKSALDETDPVCQRTMHRFVSLYGAEAGNLALKALATGGLYVGGGIAPKILPLMREGFFTAFAAKGRFGSILARIPIRVILNDSCAILGAARAAARTAARAARAEVTP